MKTRRILLVAAVVFGVVGLTRAEASAVSGTVETWGDKIGPPPVAVAWLPVATDVQAANWGGLSIDEAGSVWQWKAQAHPHGVEESGPVGATSIGEGYSFSAAVDSAGNVWTWGDNDDGDLCLGKNTKTVKNPKNTGITGATEVTGGSHRLAILLSDGRVLSCGSDAFGQLGNGESKGQSSTPVFASGIDDATEVSAGDTTDVALEFDGTVWAWGKGDLGEIGNGQFENVDVPTQVMLPGPASEVYAGGDLSSNGSEIALLDDGTVWAWGDDAEGQLGPDGNGTANATPVQVPLPVGTMVTWAGMSGETGYALDSAGNLWAWGDDSQDEYGNGASSSSAPGIVQTGCSQVSVVANKVVAICS